MTKKTEKNTSKDNIFDHRKIDYKNIELLQRYTSERGKILPRRLTLASAKEQREISKAVKRARFLALMTPIVK